MKDLHVAGTATGVAAFVMLLCAAAPAFAQAVSNGEDASATAVTSSFPASSHSYQIRPGDVITISVYNEPNFSQASVRVLPGGVIEEPLAGQIHVGGMTPDQAGRAVGHALQQFVRHPAVSVSVAAVAPVDVYILGNVKAPGKYQLQPDSRLMDALSAAGGLGPTDGDLPDAHLESGDKVSVVSLQHLLHDGDLALNAQIHGQTTIYVPSPTVFNVEVQGAVDHQGDVPLHEGDRLIAAIARAGPSQTANADLNHVQVIHTAADGSKQAATYNMYEIYKSGDLTRDPVLAKGDIVRVPGGKKGAYDPTNVLSPLLYLLRF